jgi:DNA polymerase-3 subunit delta'
MALKNIIGQEKAAAMLLAIIERRRLASSYLFAGETGIGKKTTALNFAKALNCMNAAMRNEKAGVTESADEGNSHLTPYSSGLTTHGLPFDACDACDSCAKISAGIHPDIVIVAPEERQIRIDEIRMIDEALSFRPFEGRKKVVIVDDAEMMNIAAANAFLKTLEEPPEESVIVLVSSRPDLLLPTIRSRCSRINFSPLSSEACRRVLEGKIPEENIEVAARLSGGRPGLALAADLQEEKQWFFGLLESMLHAEKDGWASREDMELWFDHSLALLRDMAVLKISDKRALITPDRSEQLSKLSKSAGLEGIIDLYRELNRLKGLLMYNLNKSVTWNYTASLLRKELAAENV